MTKPSRILIAEDQGMMRSALATLLELEPDLEVAAQVGRGDLIVQTAVDTRPDVALLDIELPGRSGLDVIEELGKVVPETFVIMVTTFGRPGYLRRALASGARGFLVKDDPVDQLAAAIRRVLDGEIVVNPVLAAQALRAAANPLTDREREALFHAGTGASIADIAKTLNLSVSTVRNYLSSAIGKTGTRNRVEAQGRARDEGWL